MGALCEGDRRSRPPFRAGSPPQAEVAEFQEARRRGEAASLDLSAEWARAARAAQPRPAEGHAPREASNQRSHGSRRGERASSSSSDDPGEGESDPEPQRTCPCGCGSSIEDHRADAEFLNHTHQVRWLRRRERAEREAVGDYLVEGQPPTLKPCRCGGWTYLDHEGDEVCHSCGRWVNPSRLRRRNGWEERVADFTLYAVGEHPRRRKRPIPERALRDWQRKSDAQTRTYFTSTNNRGGRPKEVNPAPPAANS